MRRATLLAALLLAQSQPPQTPTPTFRGGTNIVLVDVSVVGRDSRDVEDLTAADFEVLDDGVPVAIATFRHISGWDRQSAGDLFPIRTVEDEEFEASRDDVRLFGIFLDEYHVSRFEPLKVVPALVDFVRALPPADLVAVYFPGLSARDIRYTRDREMAIRAIRSFQGRQGIYMPTRYPFEEEHLRHMSDIERLRMQVTVSSLEGAVIHLDTLKDGRKTLIVVTHGVGDVVQLARTASQSNVAIYPLDPQGLTVGPTRGAENALRVLADETGGRALVSTNDFRHGLSRVLDDTGAYYLIGYVSPRPNDGRFHQITVRVNRPKVDVRARKGYWALTNAQADEAAAAPVVVPAAVQNALSGLADALRPDRAETLHDGRGSAAAAAPTILSALSIASATRPGASSRPEFRRSDRVVVRARVDSSVVVRARLLSRLGQRLIDLPVTVNGTACDVAFPASALGTGDYVIELTARSGETTAERYVAFRVIP